MLTNVVYGARRSVVHPTVGLPAGPFTDDPAAIVYPSSLPSMPGTADASADLRKVYTSVILNQAQDDKCVAEAMQTANDFAVRGTGATISELGVWKDARALEGARDGAGVFQNTGCETTDAYSQAISRGWYRRDANDDAPSRSETPETVDEVVGHIKVPARLFVPLADGDTDSLHKWATAQCGGTFTAWVGPAFQALNSSSPIWLGETSSGGGYHRLTWMGFIFMLVNGVMTSVEVVQNSWSASWGDSGYFYVPTSVFQKVAIEPVVHVGGLIL